MQKLNRRTKKNTPTDTSLVRSNCGLLLNKEETLSVVDLKTRFNNPEVNQPEYTQGHKVNYVYVLSKSNKPLMPCVPAKAKHLLKAGKAKVIKKYPFTIRLNFKCENKVQKVVLGIDSGYGNIGFSVVSESKELIAGILKLDSRTSERLTEKRMYRKNRRSKLWYRKPRFLNKSNSTGWLSPSIQRRYNTHLNLIGRLKRILPILGIIIEVAKFDIQKIINPQISGKEYQQGDLYQYQNLRSYLLSRENGKCQLCKRDFKGQPAHIHHCKQRSESGSNRPKNLAILHKKCHIKLHKKGLKLLKAKQYKPNIFMSIINKKFYNDIPEAKMTYGYITFVNRNKLGLEKSHVNDAFIIANGSNQERCKDIKITQIHRNNRILQINRKGFKPSIRREKSKISSGDLFWINGRKYFCKGMHGKGRYIYYESDSKKQEYFKFSDVEKVYYQGSLIWN